MKPIPFFKDTIAIEIASCSDSSDIGTVCSIKDFANDEPVALYELDNGDLYVAAGRYPNTRFMEGPEVLSMEKAEKLVSKFRKADRNKLIEVIEHELPKETKMKYFLIDLCIIIGELEKNKFVFEKAQNESDAVFQALQRESHTATDYGEDDVWWDENMIYTINSVKQISATNYLHAKALGIT